MPEKKDGIDVKSVEEVERNVAALNRMLGSYPPRIGSEQERTSVYGEWSEAAQQVWKISASEPETETTLLLLSELYRQGHNLDIEDAGSRASQAIARCLERYPDSVRCHFSAAYFYLSINPKFSPKGEASLHRLRELLKTREHPEVERGFVFAYLYQGRNEEALKQAEYLLTLDADDKWAREIRDALAKGNIGVKSFP